MENITQNLGRNYLEIFRNSGEKQIQLQVNDFLIMSSPELAAWLPEGEAKEHVLMNKLTEPRNKLNDVMVKILEIKGEALKVSVDGREVEIPTIFFQKYAEGHKNA